MKSFLCFFFAFNALFFPSISSAQNPFAMNSLNVKALGAKADGISDDTQVFQKAIDSLSTSGGGTVYIPSGSYLLRPLNLKSNLTVYLDHNATLLGSTKFEDYPIVTTRWEGTVCKGFQPLLYAFQQKNIIITGPGTIDGQGQVWWDEARRIQKLDNSIRKDPAQLNQYTKKFGELNKDCPKLGEDRIMWLGQWLRPALIQFYECENILLDGLTIKNSPFWTVHPVFTKQFKAKNLTIVNPKNSPNTDAIDVESCDGVVIEGCSFDVGDDCIVIKSGINEDGRKYNIPTQNVMISNCRMFHGHGAVVIGSEMSGGVKNVVVTNCIFNGTGRGVRVKSTRGRGGYVKNLLVTNIVMEDIIGEAFDIDLFYYAPPTKEIPKFDITTPKFTDFKFSHIQVNGCKKLFNFKGLDESPIENIVLTDISSTKPAESLFQNCKNVHYSFLFSEGKPLNLSFK